MSKNLSILFLVLSSMSFNFIYTFWMVPKPGACLSWSFLGSIIVLGFSIIALTRSYKIKSIQKNMSVIGVVLSSICIYFIVDLSFIDVVMDNPMDNKTDFDSSNYRAIGGWGMFSMLYAIPFAIVLLVKGKPGHEA